MAVTITNTGTTHALNGMAIKFDISQYQNISLFPDTDERDFSTCCYYIPVLADTTGLEYQNDISGFMFKLAAATDTLSLFLEKDNVQVAALNTTTYGTPYALGSITYYTDQSLLTGYILEWSKVLSAFGMGIYRLRLDYTTLGVTTSSYSNYYDLKTFSFERANGTIRIESYMNGYIMRTGINYKGLNFPNMMRVKGYFGNPEEKYDITNDIFANYSGEKRVVIQRKVNQFDIYNFETYPLPKCIADEIRYYHFLGNTIYMSDYNNCNHDYELKQIPVYKNEAFNFKYTHAQRGVIIRGKLNEQIQNLQKTNC